MRKVLFALAVLCTINSMAQVGIGTTTPNLSAALELKSDSCGVLIPRMRSVDIGNIRNPATGLLVYDTDIPYTGFHYNVGTPANPNWSMISSNVVGPWTYTVGGSTVSTLIPNVTIGQSYPAISVLTVNGDVVISGANNYRYRNVNGTGKSKSYRIQPSDLVGANPAYTSRIDDGANSNSLGINGMGSIYVNNGVAGNVAYWVAPIHLPDSAEIGPLTLKGIKTGGTLSLIGEVFRTDNSGYGSNTAQLITSALIDWPTAGQIQTVSSPTTNSSINVVDNFHYSYFLRISTEQNQPTMRFCVANLFYMIKMAE